MIKAFKREKLLEFKYLSENSTVMDIDYEIVERSYINDGNDERYIFKSDGVLYMATCSIEYGFSYHPALIYCPEVEAFFPVSLVEYRIKGDNND